MASSPGSSLSDRELVTLVIAHDNAAANIFVLRFSRFIWWVFIQHGGIDKTCAEDLYQELFVRLFDDDYRRLRLWSGEGAFVSYLGPIVRHLAADHLRSRREFPLGKGGRDDDEPAFDPVDDEPSPEELAMVREQREQLERAVAGLSARDRLLYRLRHEEDCSYAEIAQATEMTVNAVGVALGRLVKKLKALVEDDPAAPSPEPPDPPGTPGGVISPGPGPSGA